MILQSAWGRFKHSFWMAAFLTGILTLPSFSAQEGKYLELGWKDLVKEINYDDPFKGLSKQQLGQLSIVAKLRSAEKSKQEPDKELRQQAENAALALKNSGVDVDDLLAEVQEIARRQGASVVEELNGKDIRMPGYALPLEFRGKQITEFLLVPWVGACIHTPPPPPNQIVYVKAEQGIANPGGFQPVWVIGRMQVKAQTKELYLVDGSDDIRVGYSLEAYQVEIYKESSSGTP